MRTLNLMDDLLPGGGGGGLCCAQRRMPRKRRDNLLRSLFVVVCMSLLYIALVGRGGSEDSPTDDHVFHRRLLQATNGSKESSSSEEGPLFPPDIFSRSQLRQGAVVLHIIGIVYMFYALALVCDEFFVPSLDVITEKLGISPDVAGATFMAAGGSAPELFTSIIGVFIAKNDVGVGTIVGSAVFNILFVIAACAFAAKEVLSLSAWPLIRDVFFYSVSLAVLVAFFIDEKIEWWEALILFLWYFAYVGFMKFNELVEDKLRECFKLPKRDRGEFERGVTLRNAQNRKGLFHLMNETINPGILQRNKNYPVGVEAKEMEPLNPPEKEIMIGESSSGIGQLKTQLKSAGSAATDVSTAGNGTAPKEMDEMGSTENTAVAAAAVNAGPPKEAKQHNNELWASSTSVNPEGGAEKAEEDDEGEPPIDMSFPKEGGWKAILVYLISFPIMFPLYLTLPDTKNSKKRRFFVFTFVGSIIWIALFSYLMVWWATVAGDVIGIPPEVMGLTFLAAGTSVPDLITSVLVAKQGKGDMAVSSSVGSNIFDVCVGLPLPWLLYTAVFQKNVTVSSDGLGCSVLLLFIMLLLVFLSILVFRWKMTKAMGIIMMALYFVFVIVTLGFTDLLGWYECPIRI